MRSGTAKLPNSDAETQRRREVRSLLLWVRLAQIYARSASKERKTLVSAALRLCVAVSLALHTTVLAASAESQSAPVLAGRVKSVELWFDAKASLGAFRGVTKVAHGQMSGGAGLASVHGFVEMQATSLSTDNGMRDKDMRKTLEVEKFPIIRYDLDSVGVRAETPDSARIELIGRMTIHGVSRPLRIPTNLRRQGAELRVTGGCDLFLPAYGVTKLKRMLGMLSMEETIRMGFDVVFTLDPRTENK